jgi:L,D-transpeptidase ErfK/SrfK
VFLLAAGYACTVTVNAQAATFALPAPGNTIVGETRVVTDVGQNTLLDIARHYDLGYHEIEAANRGIDLWAPGKHQKIVVPTEFILPPKPWTGIVINMPQRRLYYFPKPETGQAPRVMTYPLSIFRSGWPTPLGTTRVIGKHKDPSWFVPKSIQEEHRRNGEPNFPTYFPPGPDNPMGMLAIQTGFPAIFIHGTNKPWGVGLRTSHGCFHLYPENAAEIFPILPVETPVRIINAPYVIGRRENRLYMAAFERIADYPSPLGPLTCAVAAVVRLMSDEPDEVRRTAVDWERVPGVAQAQSPVPAVISPGGPTLEEYISAIRPEVYRYPPYGKDANGGLLPKKAMQAVQ